MDFAIELLFFFFVFFMVVFVQMFVNMRYTAVSFAIGLLLPFWVLIHRPLLDQSYTYLDGNLVFTVFLVFSFVFVWYGFHKLWKGLGNERS